MMVEACNPEFRRWRWEDQEGVQGHPQLHSKPGQPGSKHHKKGEEEGGEGKEEEKRNIKFRSKKS